MISKLYWYITYKFEHVPVKYIVIGEALSVEEVPEQLAEVWVVWLVIETQGAAEVQVCSKLSCGKQKQQAWRKNLVTSILKWKILKKKAGLTYMDIPCKGPQ